MLRCTADRLRSCASEHASYGDMCFGVSGDSCDVVLVVGRPRNALVVMFEL
jgi:hypothetical protein